MSHLIWELGLNLRLVPEEQQELLTAESFLQPHTHFDSDKAQDAVFSEI